MARFASPDVYKAYSNMKDLCRHCGTTKEYYKGCD